MALPFIMKIIFLIFMFVCIAATAASLYLPRWEAVSVNGTIQTRGLITDCIQRPDIDTGDVQGSANSVVDAASASLDPCKSVFENSDTYVKAILGIVAISVLLQFLAIAWTFVSFCYCCCSNLFAPIGGLTGLAGALNIISVVVFYSMSVEDFKHITDNLSGGFQDDSSQSFFNIHAYSLFIMIISGLVLLVVCTGLAVAVQKVDKREDGTHEEGRGVKHAE